MSTTNSSVNHHKPELVPEAGALERLPHVLKNIQELWGFAEFEPYVNHLILESRDGQRQGLPWDVAMEMFFLMELSIAKRALKAAEMAGMPFDEMFARFLAGSVIAGQFGEGVVDLMTATQFAQPERMQAATSPGNASTNRRQHAELSPAASAVERLPHVISHIQKLWGQSEFEPYLHNLIMESRDGKRKGLPWEAAREMFFLLELRIAKRALKAEEMTGVPFSQMFAQFLFNSIAAGQFGLGAAKNWADVIAHRDAGRSGRNLTL